jgi:hypothetical protein
MNGLLPFLFLCVSHSNGMSLTWTPIDTRTCKYDYLTREWGILISHDTFVIHACSDFHNTLASPNMEMEISWGHQQSQQLYKEIYIHTLCKIYLKYFYAVIWFHVIFWCKYSKHLWTSSSYSACPVHRNLLNLITLIVPVNNLNHKLPSGVISVCTLDCKVVWVV